MIWVTDALNGNKVAINPQYVVAIFKIPEGIDNSGKTAINLTTGSIVVEENELDIVGMMA
jgi:uncharacterized protein YlzI (FlbEa/FlbD family)